MEAGAQVRVRPTPSCPRLYASLASLSSGLVRCLAHTAAGFKSRLRLKSLALTATRPRPPPSALPSAPPRSCLTAVQPGLQHLFLPEALPDSRLMTAWLPASGHLLLLCSGAFPGDPRIPHAFVAALKEKCPLEQGPPGCRHCTEAMGKWNCTESGFQGQSCLGKGWGRGQRFPQKAGQKCTLRGR